MRMDALLPVVRDALAPRDEAFFELAAAEALLRCEPGALVVFGGAVLRLFGERHVRPDRLERRAEQLRLKRLEPREIGAEHHHAEVGLVAEHRHAHGLVPVGLERHDGIDDALARLGLALGPVTIDAIEEMQHAPTDRRRHRFHRARLAPELRNFPVRYDAVPVGLRAGNSVTSSAGGATTCTGTPKSYRSIDIVIVGALSPNPASLPMRAPRSNCSLMRRASPLPSTHTSAGIANAAPLLVPRISRRSSRNEGGTSARLTAFPRSRDA